MLRSDENKMNDETPPKHIQRKIAKDEDCIIEEEEKHWLNPHYS